MHSDRLPVAQAMGDIDSVAHVKFSCASIRLQRGGWENGEAETIVKELAESFSIAVRMQRTDAIAGIGAQLGPVLVRAGMRDDGLAVLETAAGAFEILEQTESAQQLRALQETIRSIPAENVGETVREAEIGEANPPSPLQRPFDPATVPRPLPPAPPTRGISEPEEESTVATPLPLQADKAEYLVWYGTNRRPNDPDDAGKGYSGARASVVHYGSCRVFIPQSHKIGSIGSPWWKRLLTWTDDRLRLLSIEEVERNVYWSGIGAQ